MADLALQAVVEAGLNPSYAAAAASQTVVNNLADVFLHVKNSDGSAHTLTVTAQDVSEVVRGYGELTKADAVVSIPAGGERMIGPFPKRAFNNTAGRLELVWSSIVGMTVAAIQVPVPA